MMMMMMNNYWILLAHSVWSWVGMGVLLRGNKPPEPNLRSDNGKTWWTSHLTAGCDLLFALVIIPCFGASFCHSVHYHWASSEHHYPSVTIYDHAFFLFTTINHHERQGFISHPFITGCHQTLPWALWKCWAKALAVTGKSVPRLRP